MGKVFTAIVFCLLLAFFAAPLVMIFTGKQMLASIIWSDFLDPMNMRPGPGDIVLGEDRKSLSELAKRLRAASAQPDEAPANRTLHVAIVDGAFRPQRDAQGRVSPPKLAIDLGRAGDAALVIFKTGAVVLRTENASEDQRAKIGVEGSGRFSLENAPKGVLAGFRVDSLGASSATLPRDYLDNADPGPNSRFCESAREWAALYDVKLAAMQIFVFRDPDRITVLPNGLGGSPAPKSSPTWTAGIECRDRAREQVQRRSNSDL